LQAAAWAADKTGKTALPVACFGPVYDFGGGGFSLSYFPGSHRTTYRMAADPQYSPGPDDVGKPVIAYNGADQLTFMLQNTVHKGLSYAYPNIRMHAYGDIASIPRADNRTQSPYHAFGPRGRVFDDAAGGLAATAAPSVAASPPAPSVAASPAAPSVVASPAAPELPVCAASHSAAISESAAAANLSEDDSAAGGSAASDAPVIPAAASSALAGGSEEWGGAAAAVGGTGKRKRKGDRESSAKGSEESGGAAAAAVGETASGEGKRKGGPSREQRALMRDLVAPRNNLNVRI